MRKITCLMAFFMLFQTISAQRERTLTGNVNHESGEAIIGASIIVLSTGQGTATNIDGAFSLKLPEGEQKIKISSVGYNDSTIVVKPGQTHINIVLREKVVTIDEVVVVGYGTQRKSELTNAISSISFDKLENIPQANTMNILAGRIPGLNVIQTSGDPGDDGSEVSLRGLGTTGWSNPLVIIDGITSTMSDLSRLPPSEIDNISVLKDAASTAIYGSRGAYGVILVTTKSPTIGKLQINLNSQLSFQQATYLPRFVESWQWMILQNEAKGSEEYPQDTIDAVRNGKYSDSFANDDFVSSLFRVAPQNIQTISVSGGSSELSFRLSFDYVDQKGIMHNTGTKRYNYRASLNAAISKNLIMGADVSGYDQSIHSGYNDPNVVMRSLLRVHPITPEKYANGDWGVYNMFTGVKALPPRLNAETGRYDRNTTRLNMRPYITFSPFKNLSIKSTLAYTNNIERRIRFNPTYTYYAPNGTIGLENKVNTLINTNIESNQLQTTTTATYNFKIKKVHSFNILGGYEFLDYRRTTIDAKGSGLPSNDLQVMDLATTNISVTGENRDWAFESVFGRLNYSFKNKYLFQMNARSDGSSRLPEKNRYHVLYSFSGGWFLSKEKFFAQLPFSKQINNLKFRVAYGQAGNDPLGSRYFIQNMDSHNFYYFGEELIPGTAVIQPANEDINWVITTASNLGVDLQMFKNSLNITIDLYDKTTDNVIYDITLAPSMGFSERFPVNLASASNKGIEWDIQYRNKADKVEFYIGLNGAYNKNQVASSSGEVMITEPFIMVGKEAFNSYYGLVYDGIVKDSAELATTPKFSGQTLRLGAMKFKDLNGDSIINDDDRKVIGSSNIPYQLGLTGGITYRGFDMNFLIQGVIGKKIYIKDDGNKPKYAQQANFWKEWWDNRYHPVNNPDGTWPAVLQGDPGVEEVSTFYLHDASYLRLKNIEIGYSLPNRTVKKLYLTGVRFYVAGQNLFTFSPLIKQVDPERGARLTNNAIYPQVKLITGGVNISL